MSTISTTHPLLTDRAGDTRAALALRRALRDAVACRTRCRALVEHAQARPAATDPLTRELDRLGREAAERRDYEADLVVHEYLREMRELCFDMVTGAAPWDDLPTDDPRADAWTPGAPALPPFVPAVHGGGDPVCVHLVLRLGARGSA